MKNHATTLIYRTDIKIIIPRGFVMFSPKIRA